MAAPFVVAAARTPPARRAAKVIVQDWVIPVARNIITGYLIDKAREKTLQPVQNWADEQFSNLSEPNTPQPLYMVEIQSHPITSTTGHKTRRGQVKKQMRSTSAYYSRSRRNYYYTKRKRKYRY